MEVDVDVCMSMCLCVVRAMWLWQKVRLKESSGYTDFSCLLVFDTLADLTYLADLAMFRFEVFRLERR